jgi:hypothetical protein
MAKNKQWCIRLLASTILLTSAGYCLAVENITKFNGEKISVLTKKLGSPDKIVDTKDNRKVYAWEEVVLSKEYIGKFKLPLTSPIEYYCIAQVLVSNENVILDAAIDGNLLPCAMLKKKIGLIE